MYDIVLHVPTQMWMIGRIEDHVAKPLSRAELEAVCKILNEHDSGTKTAVHRIVVKDPPKDETVAWDKDGRQP